MPRHTYVPGRYRPARDRVIYNDRTRAALGLPPETTSGYRRREVLR